jgi:metallo-beta-lactamase family protein
MATLTFLGAAQEVTGSCHRLDTRHGVVLLDCGMRQGRDEVREDGGQSPPRVDAREIDAVVLSHAHLDHSGELPRLVRAGYRKPIYCTPATIDLLRVLLLDACYLHLKDVESENRWRERAGKPLREPDFTLADVDQVMELCVAVPYHQVAQPTRDLRLTFLDAGHILGSAIVQLDIDDGECRRRLVFSGDLGNAESVLMPNPELIDQADYVILEGTYGNRDHKPYADTITEFAGALEEAHADGGNVLIPAFAVGRTQEVLYHLAVMHAAGRLRQSMVVLDSPMAIEVTQLYQRHRALLDIGDLKMLNDGGQFRRALDFLRLSRTTEESMAINRFQGGAIIIAGSGMCEGGRIIHHLKHNLWRRQAHIVVVGFQARGTLGRRIVDGQDSVRLFGHEIAVRARVHTLGGFSAHAGRTQLLDWAKRIGGKPHFHLVHGEVEALEALRDALAAESGNNADVATLKTTVTLG